MLRINQLKLPVSHTPDQLREKLLQNLRIREKELKQYTVRKRSLDARKKPELYYVYTIDFTATDEERLLKRLRGKVQRVKEIPYAAPAHGSEKMTNRPVVVGCGPAGLFCAFLLASEGYRPLIVERGAPVRERKEDVERFWEQGCLDPESNVQFGEGGAGTFSDGKLNTLVKDSCGRNRFVLETFVRFGAPEDILWEQKPHIGTDILMDVVEKMRESIIRAGGEFRFHTKVADVIPEAGCLVLDNGERIRTDAAVFAPGHSARDTFQMLNERGVDMEAKSFAVGVRVEHPQSLIDGNAYGRTDRGALPAAAYKLTEKLEKRPGRLYVLHVPGRLRGKCIVRAGHARRQRDELPRQGGRECQQRRDRHRIAGRLRRRSSAGRRKVPEGAGKTRLGRGKGQDPRPAVRRLLRGPGIGSFRCGPAQYERRVQLRECETDISR